MANLTDDEKIAAFIRERGVTVCPPAWAEGAARDCEEFAGNVIAVDFGQRRAIDDRIAGQP